MKAIDTELHWSFRWMMFAFLILLPLCSIATFGVTFIIGKILMALSGC